MALVFLFLTACGGSSDDGTTNVPPVPRAIYAASVPATAVVTLDGSASTETSGGTLTYSWVLTSAPSGSVATISNATAVQALLNTDATVGTYTITLTVNDGFNSASVVFTVTAAAFTPPTILSDIKEPVSGVVELALSVDQGTSTVAYTVDGASIGSGATVSWNTSGLADGSHVVVAQVQSVLKYYFNVTQTFQVMQVPVSFTSATIAETGGSFNAIVGAQSVNGIVSVAASLDGVTIGSLAVPNACTDPSGATCAATGANGYEFSGTVTSGEHVVTVTATDGIGKSLSDQLRLNVTDIP